MDAADRSECAENKEDSKRSRNDGNNAGVSVFFLGIHFLFVAGPVLSTFPFEAGTKQKMLSHATSKSSRSFDVGRRDYVCVSTTCEVNASSLSTLHPPRSVSGGEELNYPIGLFSSGALFSRNKKRVSTRICVECQIISIHLDSIFHH